MRLFRSSCLKTAQPPSCNYDTKRKPLIMQDAKQNGESVALIAAEDRIKQAINNRHGGVTFDKPDYRLLAELPRNLSAASGTIRHLNISGTRILDLKPLMEVQVSLESLILDVAQVSALNEIIEDLVALRKIKIIGSDDGDNLSTLNLRSVENLALERLVDVRLCEPLFLRDLRSLILDRCTISELDIPQLTRLSTLTIVKTKIPEISSLSRLKGLANLRLSGAFSDFSFISELPKVSTLNLRRSNVKDLNFVRDLRDLKSINIRDTPVQDLSPLLDAPSLLRQGGGVTFRGANACRVDPILQRISHISNLNDRTSGLFDYLKEQEAAEDLSIESDGAPPDDLKSAPTYYLEEGRPLYSMLSTGNDFDPSIIRLHEEVLRKTDELIEASKSSNEFVSIRLSAEHYRGQIAQPIDDIDLRLLWSSANSLRRAKLADDRAEQLHREADMLPPKIGSALQDLVETHGIFVMGIPKAADLEAEMRSYLSGDRNDDLRELGSGIVAALRLSPEAVEERDIEAMEEDATTAQFDGPSGEMAEISLRSKLWNMIGAAGRAAWSATKSTSKWGSVTILSHDFIQFLLGNETLITSFLNIAQGKMAVWFPVLMQAVRAALGS